MVAQETTIKVHTLNCFTCSPYLPAGLDAGTLCLLVEKPDGLLLVDTGPGLEDCVHKTWMHRLFEIITRADIQPSETAVRQVEALGFKPEDVHDIVLTHMHFDHCGGLPDFPDARIHVYQRELDAFTGPRGHAMEAAYIHRHIAHQPDLHLYEEEGDQWFGFPAVRVDVTPEMWLIPLHGHTRGHCGVAFRHGSSWWFHLGDAAPLQLERVFPAWLERLVLGEHIPRLLEFAKQHPKMRITAGHMRLDFFNVH